MKTIPNLALFACLGLSGILAGCYTQLYTQGYASRSLDEGGYARPPQDGGDTAFAEDSAGAARARAEDSAAGSNSARNGTVVVNNYYRESPYYRGYLVDDWEYPYVSFGFYSSGYRDYYGAYWWNGPGYHRGYYRDGYRGNRRDYRGSYPSAGGGSPGPYKSDKRLFSTVPDHTAKGRRSAPADGGTATPSPKASSQGGAAASSPPSSGNSGNDPQASGGGASSGSGSDQDKDKDKDDHPALNKGRRR